jgi:hypothetical protein
MSLDEIFYVAHNRQIKWIFTTCPVPTAPLLALLISWLSSLALLFSTDHTPDGDSADAPRDSRFNVFLCIMCYVFLTAIVWGGVKAKRNAIKAEQDARARRTLYGTLSGKRS